MAALASSMCAGELNSFHHGDHKCALSHSLLRCLAAF
jgi:hypothetical protein